MRLENTQPQITATPARGPWIATYTGRRFHLFAPDVDDVDLRDIAHALALLNRFTGHTQVPYSVAQHSVLVSLEAERLAKVRESVDSRAAAMAGLLHDAAEAYLADVNAPLKSRLPAYQRVETDVQHVIWAHFKLAPIHPDVMGLVHAADESLLATERRDLFQHCPIDWDLRCAPLPYPVIPHPWYDAERLFLERFKALDVAAVPG